MVLFDTRRFAFVELSDVISTTGRHDRLYFRHRHDAVLLGLAPCCECRGRMERQFSSCLHPIVGCLVDEIVEVLLSPSDRAQAHNSDGKQRVCLHDDLR